MKALLKKHGVILMSFIAAIAMIVTTYITKSETAWLYIFFIWSILFMVFEVYSKEKNKSK